MGLDVCNWAAIGYKLDATKFVTKTRKKGCFCKENEVEKNFCQECGRKNKDHRYSPLEEKEEFAGFPIKFTNEHREAVVCLLHTNTVDVLEGSCAERIPIDNDIMSRIPDFCEKIKLALQEVGIEYKESNFGIWCVGNASY